VPHLFINILVQMDQIVYSRLLHQLVAAVEEDMPMEEYQKYLEKMVDLVEAELLVQELQVVAAIHLLHLRHKEIMVEQELMRHPILVVAVVVLELLAATEVL